MMSTIISKYKSQDSDQVDLLFQELQIHENKIDSDKTTELSQAKLYKENLLETLKDQTGEFLLARVDSKVVGLIVWYVEKEIEYSASFAYISDIIVKQEFRGKGIGTELLKTVIENIKISKVKRIHIGVLLENYEAKKLYEKVGFSEYSIEMVLKI